VSQNIRLHSSFISLFHISLSYLNKENVVRVLCCIYLHCNKSFIISQRGGGGDILSCDCTKKFYKCRSLLIKQKQHLHITELTVWRTANGGGIILKSEK